jgi:hypothetical protein
MTGWTAPDQDVMRRIVFYLKRPDWRIISPARDASDGR